VELTGLHTMAATRHHAYRLAVARPVPHPSPSVEPVVERVSDTA